ncbi:acetate/propionate family kinase [Methylomonas sp. MS20]|uniref:acetate/propionate family kinase n=1 Tax=unclassified Methylomonas TaxID=2608980 RepID=UPI0028A32915|nr:acetate kinase [Methylomonas sp. MV1]MDT4331126.1 acetate kinase [Methylomonas sp. MV1]
MKILVLNAGSSSVKYSVVETDDHSVSISGLLERIGNADARHAYRIGADNRQIDTAIADHGQALGLLFDTLTASGVVNGQPLAGIGHRVVHGGEKFREPALIDADVTRQIAETIPLAPLHNPANLSGIEAALRQMGEIPQVAVFDTAFHHTLPDYAFRYALPGQLYREHGVRRYGFHGTSHAYVAKQAAKLLGKPLADTHLITLHLGNGASVAAIAGGVSVDTSMGMTPLEGLMMGSRCGDIDPAIAFYLARTLGMDLNAIDQLYNKASGCLGVCGENDMRAIHAKAEQGDDSARLALAMYAYRIKKYIGAYFAVLGRVDALVFTGGIGENDAWLRQTCCADLTGLGIAVDPKLNAAPVKPTAIHPAGTPVAVLVIATNEELEIALQTADCLAKRAT